MRGAKAAGLRFESKLGKELEERGLDFTHGTWLEFYDANGRGFAQPDFIVCPDPQVWFILEAKLSQTQAAFNQLSFLYLPLLQFIHPDVELIPVQVCKYLRKQDKGIVNDLSKASHGSTWHWING